MCAAEKDSSRINEIFSCLLEEYDLPKLTKKFPSVREIRTAFRCGQNTATTVLNMLAEHFHFKRIPRSKSRLSLDVSGTLGISVWNDFLYQKRECTLVVPQTSAFCWQPMVDEYNKHHRFRLKLQLICHLEEYFDIISGGSADLLLLPNHPVLTGIPGGLSRFMELDALIGNFPISNFYNSTFLRDADGRCRGIAPALVPKLLIAHNEISGMPEEALTVSTLPSLLQNIKQRNPELDYSAIFDSYINFFGNCGLDIAALAQDCRSELDKWKYYIDLFKTLYNGKLVPAISELLDFGYPHFFNHKTAMMESFYSKIPRSSEQHYSLRPCPVETGVAHSVISEILVICPGSIRYEQAWEFIKYTLSPPGQQLLLSRMNAFSVLPNLKPIGMPQAIFDMISPLLAHAVRRPCDNLLTPELFRFFESGIDRLIKYGGDVESFLYDFKQQCN